METLTIIGCGSLGKSLGRMWVQARILQIHWIVNRTLASAGSAAQFVGQGEPLAELEELRPTDFVMLSVGDDAIAPCVTRLAAARVLRPGTVVFHCSGSISSSALQPFKAQGAFVASVHPLKSFAKPQAAATSFPGTPCGIEGDPEAFARLTQLFEVSGGKVFELKPESKLLYHAGTVFVCNFLTALLEGGLRCFEAAGISREQAMELARPIMEETLRNNFSLGTAGALTGPIARGDAELVSRQIEALAKKEALVLGAYQALGRLAVEVAHEKGQAPEPALARIRQALDLPR